MIVIEILIVIFALLSLYFASRFLASKNWIMGWIRGSFGIGFLFIAIFMVLIVMDFSSYKKLLEEQPLATLSIEEIENQRYTVNVQFIVETREENYEIRGDLWQMDARIIRWLGLFRTLGAKPGYRLDRISGRYYSLEDERRFDRTVYNLYQPGFGIDAWSWLQNGGSFVPWVDAVYGSATYLPLADGAIYQVRLTSNGLAAFPVNNIAKKAVAGDW